MGCGWRPGPLKISELAEQDFHAEPEVYLGCTRCFHLPEPWNPTQHRTPRPPSPSPRTPTRAWTLRRTRRRSSSRKLSEGWIAHAPPGAQPRGQRGAQVPKALTRNPEGAWRGKTQVPRALRCSHPYPRGPVPRKPGTEAPRALPERPLAGSAPGGPQPLDAEVPRAHVEGGPPQRPARPLVLAADAIRPLGMASILLPSAAEGSCPVELGNPPILALILLRYKGCTVLRLGTSSTNVVL